MELVKRFAQTIKDRDLQRLFYEEALSWSGSNDVSLAFYDEDVLNMWLNHAKEKLNMVKKN